MAMNTILAIIDPTSETQRRFEADEVAKVWRH